VFHLYVDEYQRFATPSFATLLTEAGKYGVCTTTAHQDRQQLYSISPEVAKIKAGNNLVVFRVGAEDAWELARHFDCKPTSPLIPQRSYVDSEAQVANELANLPSRTAKIRILEEKETGRRSHAEYTIKALDLR
jgi:hypothetical protein